MLGRGGAGDAGKTDDSARAKGHRDVIEKTRWLSGCLRVGKGNTGTVQASPCKPEEQVRRTKQAERTKTLDPMPGIEQAKDTCHREQLHSKALPSFGLFGMMVYKFGVVGLSRRSEDKVEFSSNRINLHQGISFLFRCEDRRLAQGYNGIDRSKRIGEIQFVSLF